jgi:hypothetical protein
MPFVRIYYNVDYTREQQLEFLLYFLQVLQNLNFTFFHINGERWVNFTLEHFTASINPFPDLNFITTVDWYFQLLVLQGYHIVWIDISYTPIDNPIDQDDGYQSDN